MDELRKLIVKYNTSFNSGTQTSSSLTSATAEQATQQEYPKKAAMRYFLANRLLPSQIANIFVDLRMPPAQRLAGSYTFGDQADLIIRWCEENGLMQKLEQEIGKAAPDFIRDVDVYNAATPAASRIPAMDKDSTESVSAIFASAVHKTLDVPAQHPKRIKIWKLIANLVTSQRERLCFDLKMPREHQLAGESSPAQEAITIVRWFEENNKMENLIAELIRMTPDFREDLAD